MSKVSEEAGFHQYLPSKSKATAGPFGLRLPFPTAISVYLA